MNLPHSLAPAQPAWPSWRLGLAAALSAALAATLAACAPAPLDAARELVRQGDHRQGLALLEQAMKERPHDSERRIAYMSAREQAINRLLARATDEALAGRFDAAQDTYREVQAIDAHNPRAADGLNLLAAARRHQAAAEEARQRLERRDTAGAEQAVQSILIENPGHTAARALERELREAEARTATAVPQLKSRLQQPVTLEFRDAPLRLVMEALSRSAGINFVMDRDVRPDLKASIFVRNVRVEDAIDLIVQNNQLEKKVLTENTLLIYPNTPQKQREHQELLIRTFQIGNADPKQTVNLLRTLLKTRDLYVDERSNLIIMRDTPDAIRAAEKLIAAQDTAEAEVMLELEILEVSRSKVRDMGLGLPTEFSGPGGTLATIRDLTSRSIAVDTGFKLKLLRNDGETKTLANPRVRVRNREKARVHVGDRVPVISSSVVGTAGGAAGGTPVTTEQIQYLDVGIKIEAEPTIHPDDTVAVRINLDVSSLGPQTRTNAGTTAYEVGTRNAATVLRLRDGETQALMGLIRDDDVVTGSGLPGIGEAPGLDRVFGTKKTDRRSRELVLLITPHLVRPVARPAPAVAEFWSGTDAAVRLGSPFVQSAPDKAAAPPAGASAPAAAPAGPSGALSPAPLPQGAPAPAANGGAGAPQPPQPLTLSWKAPGSVRAGEEFQFELMARSDGPLKGATVQLRYDPQRFEVIGVADGGYFQTGGATALFSPRVDTALGVVFATVNTTNGRSAQGEGPLVTVRARARSGASGTASLQTASVVGIDAANRNVPVQDAPPHAVGIAP